MGKDCCLNCTERFFRCHSTCLRHKLRKEQDEVEHKEKEKQYIVYDYNNETALKLSNLTRHSKARHKGMVHRDASIMPHLNNDLGIEYEYD